MTKTMGELLLVAESDRPTMGIIGDTLTSQFSDSILYNYVSDARNGEHIPDHAGDAYCIH